MNSPRFEAAPCALCGSGEQHQLYAFAFGRETAGIVRCRSCTLAYSSPRPTPQALPEFYGQSYYSFKAPSRPDALAPLGFKERLRRTLLARHFGYRHLSGGMNALPQWLSRYLAGFLAVPQFRSDGVLLDVGCGSGERMLELESFGWNVRGLEFSSAAADAGRAAGLTIDVGELASVPLADASAATVTFYHSLEHVFSPPATLRAALRVLQPGGDLLIAVPNFGCSERHLFGKHWDWLQMPTHLFHFDRAALEQLVREAGFVHIRTTYSFNGYSVDTARCGPLRPLAEVLLKAYALIAAMLGDGKALTLRAQKPTRDED